MECSYINGHQARFLKAADRLGIAGRVRRRDLLTRDGVERIAAIWLPQLSSRRLFGGLRMCATAGQTTWLALVMPRCWLAAGLGRTVWRRQDPLGRRRLKLSPEVRALVLLESPRSAGSRRSLAPGRGAAMPVGAARRMACAGGRAAHCRVARR
jgi:ceramide glucosyltransferase